ncbi:hypothetical protein D3C81_1358390 [compost metagenome]
MPQQDQNAANIGTVQAGFLGNLPDGVTTLVQYVDRHQQVAVRVLTSRQILYQADEIAVRLSRRHHDRRNGRLPQDLEGFEASLPTNKVETRTITGHRDRSFQPQTRNVFH